jgi:hypothetical protein
LQDRLDFIFSYFVALVRKESVTAIIARLLNITNYIRL